MNRAPLSIVLLLCVALGVSMQPAAAAGPGLHLGAAIEHAELIVSHQVSPDAEHMLVHARSALAHAREALHEKAIVNDRAANKHLHQAVRELRQAEMQSRFGHGGKAKAHAEAALIHLRRIK